MNLTIKCERCGVEKEIEVKVPKFCGNECRIANLKAKKVAEPDIEVTPDVPEVITVEEILEDLVTVESPVETPVEEIPNVDELQGQTNEEENQVVS